MTTEMMIVNGLTALVNLTIRLMESRNDASAGMSRSDEGDKQAKEELEKAAEALRYAITRAENV